MPLRSPTPVVGPNVMARNVKKKIARNVQEELKEFSKRNMVFQ